MKKPKHDTADLMRRLRLRYPGDAYSQGTNAGIVLLEEVGDGAGFGNRGWSDAIAMQTWPSRGLELTGFEVKANRQDWLNELNNPAKNLTWQERVHQWYIVAPKEGVIQWPEELPSKWGLMVPKGKKSLQIAVRATYKEQPETISLELLSAVFRAARCRDAGQTDDIRRKIVTEIEQSMKEQLDSSAGKANTAIQELRELKMALGGQWEGHDQLLKTAELVRRCNPEALQAEAERCMAVLQNGANRLKRFVEEE